MPKRLPNIIKTLFAQKPKTKPSSQDYTQGNTGVSQMQDQDPGAQLKNESGNPL
jgi:hypothetical protein